MSIEPSQLLNKAEEVLGLLGVKSYSGLELTYVIKESGDWKVNFSYFSGGQVYKQVGCYKVGAQTGEIKGMWLGRTWK